MYLSLIIDTYTTNLFTDDKAKLNISLFGRMAMLNSHSYR